MISVAVSGYADGMTMLNDAGLTTLAHRIKAARQLASMRQEDLAKAAGVARSTVNEWEHARSEPSATKMFAIADATNQPLGWFAEGLISIARPEGLEPPTFWLVANGGAEGFWSDARALSIAEMWCQVETDTESTHAERVAS